MSEPMASDLQQRLAAALSGQYGVDRLLRHGGRGAVYLAHDDALDRPVAIKVISPKAGLLSFAMEFVPGESLRDRPAATTVKGEGAGAR